MRKRSSLVYWLGDSLYLNITNRCSNDCHFCLRRFKSGVGEFYLQLRKEPSSKEVIKELQRVLRRRNWEEVVFCGFGEPLERLDCVLEVAVWLRRFWGGVVWVDPIGLGYLLNGGWDVVGELREVGVRRVSVSLNVHDEATYSEVCRPRFGGAFEGVLEFVEKARRAGLETEITAVRISEADIERLREMAERLGVGFRVREYIRCFW